MRLRVRVRVLTLTLRVLTLTLTLPSAVRVPTVDPTCKPDGITSCAADEDAQVRP